MGKSKRYNKKKPKQYPQTKASQQKTKHRTPKPKHRSPKPNHRNKYTTKRYPVFGENHEYFLAGINMRRSKHCNCKVHMFGVVMHHTLIENWGEFREVAEVVAVSLCDACEELFLDNEKLFGHKKATDIVQERWTHVWNLRHRGLLECPFLDSLENLLPLELRGKKNIASLRARVLPRPLHVLDTTHYFTVTN